MTFWPQSGSGESKPTKFKSDFKRRGVTPGCDFLFRRMFVSDAPSLVPVTKNVFLKDDVLTLSEILLGHLCGEEKLLLLYTAVLQL